jgi:CRP-like cAMP-binding protein
MTATSVLKKIPFLSVLKDKDLERLETSLIRKQYAKDQLIFNKGDEGGTLYIIQKGRVRVFIPSDQGDDLTLVTLRQGDFLGELSFIDGKIRSATAQAMEKTDVLCLLRDDFLGLLRVRFDLVLKVLEVLARRLRDTDELISQVRSRGITARIRKKMPDLGGILGMKS